MGKFYEKSVKIKQIETFEKIMKQCREKFWIILRNIKNI